MITRAIYICFTLCYLRVAFHARRRFMTWRLRSALSPHCGTSARHTAPAPHHSPAEITSILDGEGLVGGAICGRRREGFSCCQPLPHARLTLRWQVPHALSHDDGDVVSSRFPRRLSGARLPSSYATARRTRAPHAVSHTHADMRMINYPRLFISGGGRALLKAASLRAKCQSNRSDDCG